MDSRDRLLDLVQTLYAAPGTSDGWHRFLGDLCTALNGSAANFISHDLARQRPMVAVAARTDPSAIEQYVGYWGQQDPWAYSPESHQLKPGRVVLGEALVPRAKLKRTAFYNEFSRHYDIADCIAVMIEAGPDRMSLLSINASDAHRFEGEAHGLLSSLTPHLERALQLHRQLAQAEGTARAALDAFDCCGSAVFLLDQSGLISFASARATLLLREADGLSAERGALRAENAAERDALRQLIQSAVRTGKAAGVGSGGALAVTRRPGRRPLRVLVAPVCSPFAYPIPSTGAIVFVTDPDDVVVPDEGEIRQLLGLTASEARLARALAEGMRLEDAAARLGLTIGTVRTRLKNIYAKTGTHRQAELMRLVLGLRAGRP